MAIDEVKKGLQRVREATSRVLIRTASCLFSMWASTCSLVIGFLRESDTPEQSKAVLYTICHTVHYTILSPQTYWIVPLTSPNLLFIHYSHKDVTIRRQGQHRPSWRLTATPYMCNSVDNAVCVIFLVLEDEKQHPIHIYAHKKETHCEEPFTGVQLV